MACTIHDVAGPFLRFFRGRRIRLLYRLLQIGPDTRVLDVGGHTGFWSLAAQQGLPLPRVTIANLRLEQDRASNFAWLIADGRQLPFRNGAFDAVIANSVIEHVGSAISQTLFAAEVQRVAGRYFVETPNRHFPVEPHLVTPFFHWLPPLWQRRLVRNGSLWGILMRPTSQQALRFLRGTRLLDAREMREFFPRAELIREKILGLTKSLIAVGGGPA